MVNYELLFTQNRIHNRWHRLYNRIDQVIFFHRDPSCIHCHPPLLNTLQFDHFWNWYSVENPAIEYTQNTQQALIDLDASLTVEETWEAIYSIVFSIRYSIEPRPYTQLRQELYNAYILTDTFRKDPFEELYQISEANTSTDSDSSTESFDIPDNFHPLLHELLNQGPTTAGLLFTDEYLYVENLFREEPVGLLFINEDLNLNLLFPEPEPVGLLVADEDLYLNQLFEEPEVPGMAALGGGFNPNILLNALNNLTNALGAGGNNWANVNNAVNALNATLTANNNAMQNCGTQAAQVPTFYGGNQDPIAWLNEFNLACAANGWNNARKLQIVPAYLKGAATVWYQTVIGNPINAWDGAANNNTFEHVFKQRFRMPALVELWSTKLDQRQQQPGESVDQYASSVQELYQRINDGAFAYPDNIQARKFITGLLPELYVAVKPFADQTLQAAIDRARACELTLKEGKKKPSNYAATIHSETTELAKIVSTLVTQVGELTRKVETQPNRYRPPRNDDSNPRNNTNNQNTTSGNASVTCYTCGQPGHISRRSVGGAESARNCQPVFKLEGASLEDKGAKPEQNPSFCTLFEAYPAQKNRPITRSHPYEHPEEEKEVNPSTSNVAGNSLAEAKEIQREESAKSTNEKGKRTVINTIIPPTIGATTTRPKKKTVVRKRHPQKVQPSISAHIQPYNIVADLQQQRANISFGQLFQISPKLRSDVGKSIRKPGSRTAKLAAQFSDQDNPNATALYCDAKIKGQEIPLILDSRAAGSIVSCRLLNDLGMAIDRPSTTLMINVNGERKRPLGEVLNFPVTIKGVTIPIDVVVTDAMTYSAIVGNDWLSKVKANIDYETANMLIHWEGKDIEVPIEYLEMPMERRRKQEESNQKGEEEDEEMSEEEEETEEEYEEEDLDEKVFCHFKVRGRPSPRIEQNSSLQLTCRFQEVVTAGIYPKENFVLSKDGVYLDKSFYLWTYFARLNEQFQRKPPKRATWTYDWKGPTARCWCGDRLFSPSDSCS
ncbi:unnamed protein product [Rhizophagus irregularis]|nr:unnamed protein product [Rhizophagus irregularis]